MYRRIKKITKTNVVTIEQLYSLGRTDMGSTASGHESVDCDCKVLNVKNDLNKYYGDVKRVIRHKVSKPRWKLTDEFGNSVYVTEDHSVMVVRGNEFVKAKPSEIILDSDRFISVVDNEVVVSKISQCVRDGSFDDEYVYDIEMNDETHTFVANDMLVHNSCYTSYDQIIATTDWCYKDGETNWRIKYRKPEDPADKWRYRYFCGRRSEEYVKRIFGLDNKAKVAEYVLERVKGEVKDFVLLINELKMEGYFKECFDRYAEKLQTKNYLNFELETYSDAGIWLAKKKYAQNLRWSDKLSKTDCYPPLSKIKAKGIEMIQASAPAGARKMIKKLVVWMFENPKFTPNELRDKVEECRRIFVNMPIEDMCWNKKPNGYATYVIDDTDDIKLAKKCPATISAMALYNYLLKRHPKSMTLYPLLRDGNKYKYYYCKPFRGLEMCAFESGLFPKEFAPDIDKNACFEHGVLDPMNRFMAAMGFNKISFAHGALESNNKLF